MPKSLEYIKILGENGISWKDLHVTDAFSLVCSIRADAARKYLRYKAHERMSKAGVRNISVAGQADFDAL